jgi:CRISPR system Cascade subunit CasC
MDMLCDLHLLIANLGGDPELAGRVAEHLVHLVATVSPGAKKGSTAPYPYAEMMLIESGRRQPRTLANAFRKPTEARIEKAEEALREHLARIDSVYGIAETRRHLALSGVELPGSQVGSLEVLAQFARDEARLGTAAQSAA